MHSSAIYIEHLDYYAVYKVILYHVCGDLDWNCGCQKLSSHCILRHWSAKC